MKKDYLAENAAKQRTTRASMWALLIFIILFLVVIIRFAIRPGSNGDFLISMPTGDEAFKIAKDYMKPTLRSRDAAFADADYQYAKSSDSVYIVKSYFETNNTDRGKHKTNFTVRLKYN